MTGTWINIATVVLGTAIGVAVGGRLTESIQQRVLFGLGLVTLVIGIDLALAWGRDGRVGSAGSGRRGGGAGRVVRAIREEVAHHRGA